MDPPDSIDTASTSGFEEADRARRHGSTRKVDERGIAFGPCQLAVLLLEGVPCLSGCEARQTLDTAIAAHVVGERSIHATNSTPNEVTS